METTMTRTGKMMLAAILLSAAAVPAFADGMARPVRVAPVHFEEREQSITITGEVVARVETELSFRVGGRITGWFVDVGGADFEGVAGLAQEGLPSGGAAGEDQAEREFDGHRHRIRSRIGRSRSGVSSAMQSMRSQVRT